MTAIAQDDGIEVISIHENNNQAFYDLTPSDVTDKFRVIGGDDVTDKTRVIPKEIQSIKQKKIARIVMAVAIMMLLTSVLLVAITLTMSDHIDDMVRKMHGDIRRPKEPTNSGPVTKNPSLDLPMDDRNVTDGG